MTQQLTKYSADVPVEFYGNAGQLTETQKDVITAIARGATKTQLSVFFGICERYRLDPFDASGQVWFVRRGDTWSAQIGVAGQRLIAERTGRVAGKIGPEWSSDGIKWLPFWLPTVDRNGKNIPPALARFGLLKRGETEWMWGYVTWDEWVQTKDGRPLGLWASKPSYMLGIRAESVAYRRAFPLEIGALPVRFEEEDDAPDLEPSMRPSISVVQERPPAQPTDLYPPEDDGPPPDPAHEAFRAACKGKTPRIVCELLGIDPNGNASEALSYTANAVGWDLMRKCVQDGVTIAVAVKAEPAKQDEPERDILAPDDLPFDTEPTEQRPMFEHEALGLPRDSVRSKGAH